MQLPSKTSILKAQRRDDCFPLDHSLLLQTIRDYYSISTFFFVSTLVTKHHGGRDNATARFGMMDYGELG